LSQYSVIKIEEIDVYNKEAINKKLRFADDTLIIDSKELQRIDEKPVKHEEITEMELYYYHDNTSTHICNFTVVIPDKENLKNEISVIIDTYKNKDKKFFN
jgi:hypothetical protein